MVAAKVMLTAFMAGFLSGQCDQACKDDGEDFGRFSIKEKSCICSHKMDPMEAPLRVNLYLKKLNNSDPQLDDRPYIDYQED